MGQIFRRTWKSGPRRVRRVAWGYTLQIDGKQERRFRQEWSPCMLSQWASFAPC